MLTPNHPDDERLSALAARDADATADATLTAHVDSCAPCADLVAELGALRASLAELPDVAPSRPLRLLSPVEEPRPATADRVGGWVRRLFAPALTAGAALAMVGLVGTGLPAMQGLGGAGDAGAEAPDDAQLYQDGDPEEEADAVPGASDAPQRLSTADAPAAAEDGAAEGEVAGPEEPDEPTGDAFRTEEDEAASAEVQGLPAERSPWPMLLFTGVALMIGALLLRWILVPRAG